MRGERLGEGIWMKSALLIGGDVMPGMGLFDDIYVVIG